MDRRFFHRLGASRLDRTICSTAGMAGMTEALGIRYATEPEQFRHSKLILAWGANILGTNVHLWPFIVEARRNGAKFYTIDPNRNRTGAASDRHYFINPGSDIALALAMMHVIIGEGLHDSDYIERHTDGFPALRERVKAWTPQRASELTGIAAEDIVQLAREYATTRPAAIRLNYGVQRSERGATAMRTIASGAGSCQRAIERCLDILGHVARYSHARNRRHESFRDDRLRVGTGEWRFPTQHFVKHASKAVEITSSIDRCFPARLLRAHVRRRADSEARVSDRLAGAQRLADTEIRDECGSLVKQDVLRLDVTMNYLLTVRVVERGRHLGRNADRVFER